jgi:capping protein beta
MNNEKIAAALSLCRRLPPSKLHKNALALSNLIPELSDDLLSKIDKPLGKYIFKNLSSA